MNDPLRVVIVGGGFGGLYCAKSFRHAPVHVTLVDRRNFHLFQPLLYQVATGGLSPANIAAPLRAVLARQKNAEVLMGEVTGFDLASRQVLLSDGELPYDYLIVAAGSETAYFGHDDWSARASGLKSIEEATEIRRRVLLAFEMAERSTDAQRTRQALGFVVVGGGPTGVELAGAVAEMARHTLVRQFRNFDPASARIVLVEGADRVLFAYPPETSAKALEQLESLGVTVRTGCRVTDVRDDGVTVHCGVQGETIDAMTVVWAAGVQASPLGAELAQAASIQTDRQGRIAVEADLSLPGHPEVFVIGDLANYSHTPDRRSLPGLAPVAMQQGRYVAQLIAARQEGRALPPPFRYRDHGTMATIGRARAVAVIGRLRLAGFLAWLAWLFIHLMYIVQFENRVLIFLQWAWNYLSWNRSARLITGDNPLPFPRHDVPVGVGEQSK